MTIDGRDGNHFWLYKNATLDKWLRSACAVYFPGFTEMTPTKLRVYWETLCHHDKDFVDKIIKAKETVSNVLDHTPKCGARNYARGKARKMAEDTKVVTIAYFGHLIEWPAGRITPDLLDANIKAVREKFSNIAACDDDEQMEAMEDDDGDADEHDDCSTADDDAPQREADPPETVADRGASAMDQSDFAEAADVEHVHGLPETVAASCASAGERTKVAGHDDDTQLANLACIPPAAPVAATDNHDDLLYADAAKSHTPKDGFVLNFAEKKFIVDELRSIQGFVMHSQCIAHRITFPKHKTKCNGCAL